MPTGEKNQSVGEPWPIQGRFTIIQDARAMQEHIAVALHEFEFRSSQTNKCKPFPSNNAQQPGIGFLPETITRERTRANMPSLETGKTSRLN